MIDAWVEEAAKTGAGSPGPSNTAEERRTVMTASAAVREPVEATAGLTLVERPERLNDRDLFAQLVVDVVALVGSPLNPSLIAPTALILSSEGLVELPGVTFGCNYDLDV